MPHRGVLNRCRFRASAVAGAAAIALGMPLLAPSASAQETTPAPAAAHPAGRWLDAQAVAVRGRYNFIEAAGDETVQNRLQTQIQIKGRFKIDEAGRYSVHAGLFTGGAFDSGWNPTGIGTGQGTANIYLKQLFVAAEPWTGIELQYGSLYPERGESTEITTYDNDGYVTAGRVNLRRPQQLFFDDVTVSVGYIGYRSEPFVFDRTGAFSRQNYWQVMASKEVLPGLTLSTDYSVVENDGMLREGVKWRVEQPWVDSLAGEFGVRLRGGSHQTAFAFSGEKRIARVTVQIGYASVDPSFATFNGDPYGVGDRVFTTGSIPLPLDLSASWFAQKEIDPPASSRNDVRVDLVLSWDALKTLKRAGAVP